MYPLLRPIMNWIDVAGFEELLEAEFTDHADSATISTSGFFNCLLLIIRINI